MIYLISEAWSDDMENHPANAFGYKTMGYVETEAEADKFRGEMLPPDFCWVTHSNARVGIPPSSRFIVQEVPRIIMAAPAS